MVEHVHPAPERFERIRLGLNHDTGRHALVVGRWKIIDGGGGHYELYDLRGDPNEIRDLAEENVAELARMRQLLDARAAIDDTPPFP
jgi:arylsulfatase A-like enzyme